MRDVDPDDWPFVALAMFLGVPLWTGDKELLRLAARTEFEYFVAVDTEGVEMLLAGRSLEEVKERMRRKYGREGGIKEVAGDNDIVGGGVENPVDRETLELIKKVVLEEAGRLGVGVERIILFGSRARGDAREDSDWDILIVVRGEVGWRTLFRLRSSLYTRLYDLLGREVDIVIVDTERLRERRDLWGSLEYAAEREGIAV